MITLEKYENAFHKKWDLLIDSSKNGLFFFKRNFLEYHKDRFTDHSLVFLKGEEVVAVFPASEKESTIISHGGLTFGSLIISKTVKTTEVIDIFKQIKSYYSEKGFEKLIYKAIPYIFSTYPAEEDLYALFLLNARHIRRDISSVIDIKNKIEFSQSKKNLVNRFLKSGADIVEESSFLEFWDLLSTVLQKFDTKPVHSIEEIEMLKSNFPDNIRLFTVRENEELLAGIVVFDFGQVVHTQYMANSDKGRKVGALDFINYQLINEVFKDKKYYSFGISTEDGGKYLNEGLIQQKENMGGRAVALDFYELDLHV